MARSGRGAARRLLVSSLFLGLAVPALWAHPHVFVVSRLEFEIRGTECAGVRVEWDFDKVFSAGVIGQFDADRNGVFDERENELVRAKAFSNLRKYGYFTFLRKGTTRAYPEAVEGFKARHADGVVTYSFRVPLEGKGFEGDFAVASFDSTFYTDLRYAEDGVTIAWLDGEPGTAPTITIAPNKSYPVYYNPKGSMSDMQVYLKPGPGLNTAYPTEVRVRFE